MKKHLFNVKKLNYEDIVYKKEDKKEFVYVVIIENIDVITFDLARLKGYVCKLAYEQIEKLNNVLEKMQ